MTLQLSTDIRNARVTSIETTVGTLPILKIFDGAMPSNPSDPDVGTVLATINLPSDWVSNASNGTITIVGDWRDTSADNTGTAQYFRIYNNAETTCHIQGDVGLATDNPTPAMTVDNTSFAQGQELLVESFTITDGNA